MRGPRDCFRVGCDGEIGANGLFCDACEEYHNSPEMNAFIASLSRPVEEDVGVAAWMARRRCLERVHV
jgi:hypothetical protein